MRTRLLGISIAAALMFGAMSAAIPASAAGKATLNVVHGIPGVTVNVCVDGSEAIPDFQPGDVAANVQLPAGSHTFKLVAQSDTCGDTAILKKTTDLDAGKNYTVVANLNDTGAPNLKVFRNNVAKTAPGAARLTVRHTADAPAVNVWTNGARLIGGTHFTWGESATLPVPRGVYAAWVSLPGEVQPVIGPAVLVLRPGYAYQVYAWGDGTDGYHFAVVSLAVGTR